MGYFNTQPPSIQKIYWFRMTYYPRFPGYHEFYSHFSFSPPRIRWLRKLKSTFTKYMLQSPKTHLLFYIMKTNHHQYFIHQFKINSSFNTTNIVFIFQVITEADIIDFIFNTTITTEQYLLFPCNKDSNTLWVKKVTQQFLNV